MSFFSLQSGFQFAAEIVLGIYGYNSGLVLKKFLIFIPLLLFPASNYNRIFMQQQSYLSLFFLKILWLIFLQISGVWKSICLQDIVTQFPLLAFNLAVIVFLVIHQNLQWHCKWIYLNFIDYGWILENSSALFSACWNTSCQVWVFFF